MNNDTGHLGDYSLGELLLLALDGSISEEQFENLQNEIINNPEAPDYYYDFLTIYTGLSSYGCSETLALHPEGTVDDYYHLLDRLAEEENRAPAIKIPEEKPEIEKVMYSPVEKQKTSKFSIAALSFSAAAIFFLVILFCFPTNQSGWEVATLTDTLNAKWAEPHFPMETGSRLVTGSPPLLLRKGFAEIVFDNGVKVVIESPTEFQVLAEDQIKLNYGRIYSIVPEQAYGFTVCTVGSKIIDLGTEFGVQADIHGDIELHVIKGKTSLLSGLGDQKINQEISAGFAGRLDGVTGQFQMSPYKERLFTRRISSKNSFVWRGQDEVDLADIVGSGNGFGTGYRGSYINPSDGQWNQTSGLTGGRTEPSKEMPNKYNLVPSNPFVDGIFVPNGQDGPVTVSSSGDTFKEAPLTSSKYWYGVVSWDAVKGKKRSIMLDGVLYGTPSTPALLMHSNVGITFDLYAIQQNLPEGCSITEFVSVYGISDAYADKSIPPYADFWVLVDGELKFSKRSMTVQQMGTIRIPISSSDHYLTLVSTEGVENPSIQDKDPIFNDWCIWGNPVLEIE